LTTIIVNT